MPDPAASDYEFEYIELQNISCDPLSLSWYTLVGGSVLFPVPDIVLASRETKKFFRTDTKIGLSNSSDSFVFIHPDAFKETIAYTKSQVKEDVPIIFSHDISCLPQLSSGTGETATDTTDETSSSGAVQNEEKILTNLAWISR